MSKSQSISRRRFLSETAATGAAAPYFVPSRVLGANERIQLGLIGAGGMGRVNLRNCAKYRDVAVTGVCDVWTSRREAAAAPYKSSARTYHDYREMLQRADIDAVIIATPPHWHCLQAIDACAAGKDIYLQKPMTLHLAESLAVKHAVERLGRISQVGTQIHASENYRRVVEWIRCGRLGPVSVVRTFNVQNQGPEGIGNAPDRAPPSDLDWNLWLGPGPERDYNELLARSSFHHCSFMDYSGGWTPGMAPHIIDLPYWALNLGVPTVTNCSGGRYIVNDLGDAPDVQEVLWKHPNLTMTWMQSLINSYGFDFHGTPVPIRRLGVYFHCANGTLYTDYGMHRVIPEGKRLRDVDPPEPSIPPSPGHEREWLDCIRSRKQPSCSVLYHYKIDLAIALANLSLRLGRSIRFDPQCEAIVDDGEAARLARPTYRAPWRFPDHHA